MSGAASTTGHHRGRVRDPGIDARVLAVAHRHLSELGYEAMSVAAVAQEAGTTRQALYRRWPDKASLAADALQAAADPGPEVFTSDPLADLAAELADFQRGVSRPGRLSLVGTMLQDSTAPGAGDTPLEISQLGGQVGQGVAGEDLGPRVGRGLERVGGQAGLVRPPPVQGLAGGAGLLSHGGDGHGLVTERGQVPVGDREHPGVDVGVAGPAAMTARS